MYKERKGKEQRGNKKERQKKHCVYAYNDGGNHGNGVQGMRGRGVRNDCDTGNGMNGTRYAGRGIEGMRDFQRRADDRSGYQQAG